MFIRKPFPKYFKLTSFQTTFFHGNNSLVTLINFQMRKFCYAFMSLVICYHGKNFNENDVKIEKKKNKIKNQPEKVNFFFLRFSIYFFQIPFQYLFLKNLFCSFFQTIIFAENVRKPIGIQLWMRLIKNSCKAIYIKIYCETFRTILAF